MRQLVLTTVLATLASRAPAQAPPTREEALAALRKCVGFYVDQVGATGPVCLALLGGPRDSRG